MDPEKDNGGFVPLLVVGYDQEGATAMLATDKDFPMENGKTLLQNALTDLAIKNEAFQKIILKIVSELSRKKPVVAVKKTKVLS